MKSFQQRRKTTVYLGLHTRDGHHIASHEALRFIKATLAGMCYTIQHATGMWNDKEEPSILVTYIGEGTASSLDMSALAIKYRKYFDQECVLIEEQLVTVSFITENKE